MALPQAAGRLLVIRMLKRSKLSQTCSTRCIAPAVEHSAAVLTTSLPGCEGHPEGSVAKEVKAKSCEVPFHQGPAAHTWCVRGQTQDQKWDIRIMRAHDVGSAVLGQEPSGGKVKN